MTFLHLGLLAAAVDRGGIPHRHFSIRPLFSGTSSVPTSPTVPAVRDPSRPYELRVDTLLLSPAGAPPRFVDGNLLSDTLLEIGAATSATVSKFSSSVHAEAQAGAEHEWEKDLLGTLVRRTVRDGIGGRDGAIDGDDLFDEPDVAYPEAAGSAFPAPSRGGRAWRHSVVVATMVPPGASGGMDAGAVVGLLEDVLLGDADGDGAEGYRLVHWVEDAEAEEEDWVETMRQRYPPEVLVDGRCVVGQSYHETSDFDGAVAAQYPGRDAPYAKIILEGGAAFGTGDHPTAHLCGRWVWDGADRAARSGRPGVSTLLDYGSGSGILGLCALAAARCAQQEVGDARPLADVLRVEGVDVDPGSIDAARTNAGANGYDGSCAEYFAPPEGAPGGNMWDTITCRGVDGSLPTLTAQKLPEGRVGSYDLVVANILAQPLVGLAPTLAKMVKKGTGKIGLSGISVEQAEGVAEAYRVFFKRVEMVVTREGWALLEGSERI